jgi:hypothetical protein
MCLTDQDEMKPKEVRRVNWLEGFADSSVARTLAQDQEKISTFLQRGCSRPATKVSRAPGTCEFILRSPEWLTWRELGCPGWFWIQGDAGIPHILIT